MMKLPSLKRRKPIVYISLGMYAFISVFIIVESFIPSGLSWIQSNLFATIGSWFVNEITGPQIPNEIKPVSFTKFEDTTCLGQNENDESLIAIGTTSRLTLEVTYPKKENSYDVYDNSYTLNNVTDNKDDYAVSLSSSPKDNVLTISVWINAEKLNNELHEIDINVADTLVYHYKFRIVDLAVPTEFEAKIAKNTLKIGESIQINTKLMGNDKDDYYLKRYYDLSKISRSSSSDEVATIDQFGVIHAINEGSAIINYGTYSFLITVTNENIVKPANNHLNLSKSIDAKDYLSLLDYDSVFVKEDANDYSVLIYSDFDDETLEDKSVSYYIDDNLMGMIAPFKYVDGYPVYQDDDGNNCVRVCGYRKKGEGVLTLHCVSNADPTLTATIDISIAEAIPETMNIKGKKDELTINDQIVISAFFSPENVNNKAIHLESNRSDIVFFNNNDSTSVTLKGIGIGTAHITVSSLANPDLIFEFDIVVSAKETINKENYDDFHGFVRKLVGHFSLFLVDAVFGFIFFYTYLDNKKKWWIALLISLTLGFLIAGGSELIQFFVATRGGVWLDVWIDYSGYVAGTLLTFGVFLIIDLIKRKKKKQ